ncbi:MAG: secretin N-terminal domain-containing protein [bacterium]
MLADGKNKMGYLKKINIIMFVTFINLVFINHFKIFNNKARNINPESWALSEETEMSKTGTDSEEKVVNDGNISLDLKGVEIVDLLRFLSDQTNMNIIPSKSVTGKVDLYIKKLTPEESLDAAIESFGLAYERNGNIIKVMTAQEYEQLYGEKFKKCTETVFLKLKYNNTKQIFDVLNKIKSNVGEIIITEDTGLLILKDIPNKIKLMKMITDKLDQAVKTEIFQLNYVKAKDIKEKLANYLSKEFSNIETDDVTNQLIITDISKNFSKIITIIEALDKYSKQVQIEAKIIQIQLKDEFEMGVAWEKVFGGAKDKISLNGNFSATQALGRFQKISIGTLDIDHYTAALDVLKTLGDAEIISSPLISVLDGKEASIMVGTKEAYSTQTLSQSQVTTTTAENIEYVDVGIKLSVKPTIMEGSLVILEIKPEVSTVISTLVTSLGSSVPIIEKAEANTTIMAKDNETVIIAGLIKKENRKQKYSMPILEKIPILNFLFSNKSRKNNRTELVIFLTPKIYDPENIRLVKSSTGSMAEERVMGKSKLEESTEDRVRGIPERQEIKIEKIPSLKILKQKLKEEPELRLPGRSNDNKKRTGVKKHLKQEMMEIGE